MLYKFSFHVDYFSMHLLLSVDFFYFSYFNCLEKNEIWLLESEMVWIQAVLIWVQLLTKVVSRKGRAYVYEETHDVRIAGRYKYTVFSYII